MSFENSAQPTIFAPVVDSPAFEPTDPGFSGGSQWYLDDGTVAEASLNITGVWDDYRGGGITIAVIDDGIEYSHPDLVANSDPSLGDNLVGHETTGADDGNVVDSDDKHGTTVAGVIAADDDGQGVVGVAPDATIASMRIGFGSDHSSWQVWEAFLNAKDFDIVNGSWTYSGYFFDNFNDADSFGSQVNPFVFINDELINAVDQGRGGLGTLFFMAAGNDKSVNGLPDQDVNYHGMTSSPHTIAVGGFSKQGSLTSFSTPGAAVLVSGPATSIRTTDRVGSEGFVSGDTVAKSGTSYAAPAVSGVAALMLEANPDLGYRDVQEILTLSSELVASGHSGWAINGSSNWNGGGRHVSHDAGFGSIDAHNAVRLAETWDRQSTYANLAEATVGSGAVGVTLDRNTFTDTITVGDLGIDLDQVVLHLDMDHTRIGELFVTLTSPDGTTSILMNNAGGGRAFASTFIDEYELTSVQFWDEDIAGDWTISITDNDFNANDGHQDTGVLHDWALTFLGDAATDDDVYVYTSEYSVYGGETGRQTLADGAGVDTMNFAAIQEDLTIDLAPGSTMTLAGNPLTIDAGTSIENAVGGDGNDVLIGNGADNYLRGMRGDDIMTGGVGDDLLDGGTGVDLVVYDAAFDTFTLTLSGTTVTVVDNSGLLGTDTLIDMETVVFSDATYTVGDPLDTTSPPPAEDPIPAEDTSDSGGSTGDGSGGDSSGDDSGSGGTSDPTDPDPTGKPAVVVPAVTHSGTGAGFETVTGDNGDNVLWGGGGNWDKLEGGLGNDAYIIDNLKVSIRDGSKEGEDTIYTDLASYSLPVNIERIVLLEAAGDVDGHDGDNYIEANDLANVIDGKNGRDEIHAWGGDDTIIGGGGNDVIDGGSGVDTAVFAGALADYLIKEHSDGTLTVLDMVGGDGMDRLIHVENLQFSDQTVASPNAVADPSSLAEVGWLPHPSGYAPPAPTILGTLDSFENLVGTAGDDVLYGGGGDADTLTGGDGNDVYFVTSNDIYTQEFNGGGTDTAIVSAETYQNHGAVEVVYMMYGAATVYAGDGSNTVYGNELSNFIHGEAGSDTIFAYDGDDQIFGGSGDDNVEGGAGNDVIDGGNGNDTATYTGDFIQYTVTENTDGSVTVIDSTGAEGTDTLLNIERIAFADQLYVVGQTSVAVGDGTAKPAVVLPPITHAGTAAGGETITGDDGDNVLSGEGGQWDKLEGFNGDDAYIVQGNENVVIKETSHGGVDTLYTNASDSAMANNVELAYLLDSALNLQGNDSANYVEGNDLGNVISGADENDTLLGWGGDDFLSGGAGNDVINGGDGADTATFSGLSTDYFIEVQGDGTLTVLDLVGLEGTDRLANIEFLQFTDQTLSAPASGSFDASESVFARLPGADGMLPPAVTHSGTLASYQQTSGTDGNDVLASGGGYLNTLTGGNGDDAYLIDNTSTRIQEYVNGGNDTVYTYAAVTDLNADIETFYMMYGSLSLTAGDNQNTIYGNDHDNFIFAGGGDDTLLGGAGSDTAGFAGDFADFAVAYTGTGTTITVTDQGGNGQGSDTLTDVEFLEFSDQTIAVDTLGLF